MKTVASPKRTSQRANRLRMTAVGMALICGVALSGCGGNPANDNGILVAEGATSQQNAINLFADVLIREHGINLAYNATGSGAGVQKFLENLVTFAGSDSPLDADEVVEAKQRCGGHEAWHLPLVVGPVAIAYNIPGVDGLILTPEALAQIFTAKIAKWNDPILKKLNPGKKLPDENINVVYRSDKSGTTDNVQKFLTYTAPKNWGSNRTGKVWHGTGNGAQGSAGVAGGVMGNKYSITYVEGGYAKDMQTAQIDFGAGPVPLNDKTAGRALDFIKFDKPGSKDLVVDTEALYKLAKPGAYPFLLTTYEIFCSAGYNKATTERLHTFLYSALTEGQKIVSTHGFIPLPDSYRNTLLQTVNALMPNSPSTKKAANG